MTEHFDAIVIGAGQAGPSLAGRMTDKGMKVALIERHLFGGTCVNTGCMPTKALVASAYAAHLAARGADYGVMLDAPVRIDMAKVKARADTVRFNARHGVETWLNGMKGLTVLRGHARFVAPREIEVDGRRLAADRVFINVGGRATVPDLPGLSDIDYLTNTSMLELDQVPDHLVVIGGSYIGLEFGQMYRRFGAKVTVVERGPRLISREDEDVSDAVRDILEAEGIEIRTGADAIAFAKSAEGIAVTTHEGRPPVIASHVLVAVGRTPNTHDLGLDIAGVETDARGFIKVDESLATSAEGVWAMGDCNGRGAFTHTSYNDFEIIAANLLDGENRKLSDRVLGYALYIDPPLGRAGMSEAEARKAGLDILVSKRPMTRVGRAVEKGETQGFMKIVAEAGTGRILGAAFLGASGDEAVHGVLDMMSAGQSVETLRWAVPIHPTVSELIPTILLGLAPA